MTFFGLGYSLTRFLQLHTLGMVIGSIIHYQEFGYAIIQLHWRVLSIRSRWVLWCVSECTDRVYVRAPGGCLLDAGGEVGEFLLSMGEGVPLALARCWGRTALAVLGVVVDVGDEPGVGRRLH